MNKKRLEIWGQTPEFELRISRLWTFVFRIRVAERKIHTFVSFL